MEYTVYLDRFHPHFDLTGFLDHSWLSSYCRYLESPLNTCEIIVECSPTTLHFKCNAVYYSSCNLHYPYYEYKRAVFLSLKSRTDLHNLGLFNHNSIDNDERIWYSLLILAAILGSNFKAKFWPLVVRTHLVLGDI